MGDRRHVTLGDGHLRWERHSEFVSYTLRIPWDGQAKWPEDLTAPGPLLVAVDLRMMAQAAGQSAMVRTSIVDDRAILETNFAADENGFVAMTIINCDMNQAMAGATVQRVLEIETYRCFALLGLPVAEQSARVMAAIENALPSLMEDMDAASSLEDNKDLLERLTCMSLELERNSAATHFRFGATKAYAELVRLRIEALAERPDLDHQSLVAFFSRRFDPAVRTCATCAEREANLARKLTRAAQLLRTRVEIALESQNRDLLATMNDRARLQLRLQQTVEGLSVAAIAYYVASLLHLFLSGIEFFKGALAVDRMTAIAIIPILLVVHRFTSRFRPS